MKPGRIFYAKLELTSADVIELLNQIRKANIILHEVKYCSDLTVCVCVSPKDCNTIVQIAEKMGGSVEVIRKFGIQEYAKIIVNRPVLLFFAIILVILNLYLPSRVFFISVIGNTTIPTSKILEAAEECGVTFAAERKKVRSEKVKNELLEKIPELQWAGINTVGCTAMISVKEKTLSPNTTNISNQVCSIVALRDGVIQSCTVEKGNPLCSVGQVVTAGQTLVSGYIDCGVITKTTQADAEIQALTFRECKAITPVASFVRNEKILQKNRYSLQIGKKLINLYKDSGILDMTCGKMYKEEYLQLPGGFYLPVSIIKETVFYYEDKEAPAVFSDEEWLLDFVTNYLESEMVSGQIISSQTELKASPSATYFYGHFACSEMIGQVKFEDSIPKDEENGGENN